MRQKEYNAGAGGDGAAGAARNRHPRVPSGHCFPSMFRWTECSVAARPGEQLRAQGRTNSPVLLKPFYRNSRQTSNYFSNFS
jgi:hypothetical protein